MDNRDYLEKNFENAIAEGFEKQGWIRSENDKGFNSQNALYEQDLIDWVVSAYPKEFKKFQETTSQWRESLLSRVSQLLGQKGTLRALQEEVGMAGMPYFKLSETEPENAQNKDVSRRYKCNILRVVQQVHFRLETKESIDLVFFINGIPVATAEVKTNFTQDVNDAVEEYRQNRHPRYRKNGAYSALLQHQRGAIVHFAISETDIQMTTKLEGETTKFLPFNIGNNGHAGNPPASKKNPYAVSYFWKEIGKPREWLRIFHSFVFVEEKKVTTQHGNTRTDRTLIFPRYHQWRAVSKIVNDATSRGVGQNYLIEHSPGSGKTKTITWTAFRLTEIRKDNGDPFFDTVLIITDRTVLNDQLVKAVNGFNRTPGLVKGIDRSDGASKTSALQEALEKGIRIVVVTIQTFPFAMEQIILNKKLAGRTFAVIVDEAHNSQSSTSSSKLNAALGFVGEGAKELTTEDFIERIQKSRQRPKNVSFLGFTATPRHQTMMLFGRNSDGSALNLMRASEGDIPVSFDVYPMRQAIEEGFILDVLKGYLPYKTAWQIENKDNDDPLVNEKEARKRIARWKNLHPTNVTQKTEFIIRHFVRSVASLLNGQAKAMIVTSSRAAVVRYKKAFDHYIENHPELSKVAILKLGIPLAAFSGDVKGVDAIHDADKQEGFTLIDSEAVYNESNLNPDIRAALEKAFDTDDYRLMIVANKFQTGFDQPKLCAMYIDKPLGSEIEIVQTYSRLNRTYHGKDTVSIVDFVNNKDAVLKAFAKYDSGAMVTEVQDKNVIFSYLDAVKSSNIFTQNDVDDFASRYYYDAMRSFAANKGFKDAHGVLNSLFEPVAKLYNERLKDCYVQCHDLTVQLQKDEDSGNQGRIKATRDALEELTTELNILESFRKSLNKTVTTYNYLAQLVDYKNPDLEVFIAYCGLLSKYLKRLPREEIDLSGVLLTGYTIRPVNETNDGTDDEAKPLTPIGAYTNDPHSEMPEHLKVILEKISNFAGDIVSEMDAIKYCNSISDKIRANDRVMVQVENNDKASARKGLFESAVHGAVVDLFEEYKKLTQAVLVDTNKKDELMDIVLTILKDKLTDKDLSQEKR